ncbi:hypothetical protein FB451DRAFT_1233651 [Mycena latifolia]|nr:hypothetical protein FB451DRAFT_1233651 [Mycena latifolia]
MRFFTSAIAPLCVALSFSCAVLGDIDGIFVSATSEISIPSGVSVIRPVPSCPPIHCTPLVERSCIRGRCVEKRVACFETDIVCPLNA